jgi:plastocyanin
MREVRRSRGLLVLPALIVAIAAAIPAAAGAQATATPPKVVKPELPAGTITKTYKVPLSIKSGQNLNLYDYIKADQRPSEEGWIIGFKPDLKLADGSTPPVDQIHLHHLVMLLNSDIVVASGEEKTRVTLPNGFGYRYKPTDRLMLNHMIHNLTATPEKVIFEYTVDFLPASAPAAAKMMGVRTQFVDVEGGKAYPVFDVKRNAGTNGRYTYPAQASASLAPRNRVRIQHDGTLVATAGHLHPGGLYTDLFVTRGDKTVKIFRSNAYYYGAAKLASWNVSMGAASPDWRVAVKKGDILSVQVTYDTTKAAWYESMGISPASLTNSPAGGVDPFDPAQYAQLDQREVLTHGELKENRDYGGRKTQGYADARKLADGPTLAQVAIKDFVYKQGDLTMPGKKGLPPLVAPGKAIKFVNQDPLREIFHTITPCKGACDLSTGISYPLADSAQVDSGELGFGPVGVTAAANRATWSTPTYLKPGTYSYFCRIHPFMRGAWRVKKPKATQR